MYLADKKKRIIVHGIKEKNIRYKLRRDKEELKSVRHLLKSLNDKEVQKLEKEVVEVQRLRPYQERKTRPLKVRFKSQKSYEGSYGLTGNLERRIETLSNKCLGRIMGYCWFDRVRNWRLLCETGSWPIACTIRQRQLYGLVEMSSKETTQDGGGQGDVHRARGLGKLMNPAGMYLGCKRGLHVDLPGGIPRDDDVGLVRQRAIRRMLPMTD